MKSGKFTLLCVLATILAGADTLRAAAPIITSFSPGLGHTGDKVTLLGNNFSAGNVVKFYNNKTAAIYVLGVNQIEATVPSGITTGPISINGVYTAQDFIATGPGPYAVSVTPGYAATNETVIISGVHFLQVTGVKFNGTNAPVFMPNADGTMLSVTVPPQARSGPITLYYAGGATNVPGAFTVIGPGPFITGFSPAIGAAGEEIMIYGRFFTGATAVRFNGVAGVIAQPGETSLKARAPANVTTGPITVASPLGSHTTATNFFVPPTISSLTPGSGRAGTNVIITGGNLAGATAVLFNGTPAAGYVIPDNSHLQAVTPAGCNSGQIRVTTPGGSAFSADYKLLPTITNFSPVVGAVGTSVTIRGLNFTDGGAPRCWFNGVRATNNLGATAGQLTAVVPPGGASGPITVSNAYGLHTTAGYFYLPPTLAAVSPSNAPAFSRVTFSGANLLGASAVAFNGAEAVSFTVTNNNTVGVTVPDNVISGPVTLTTPAGTAVGPNYYGAPSFGGFFPTHGAPGVVVTITGNNFLGASKVRFNGLETGVLSGNNSQVTAVLPNGALTGPIAVVTPAGVVASSTNFVVDYTSDVTAWATNSPSPVTVSRNLTNIIAVANYGPYKAIQVQLTSRWSAPVEYRSISVSRGSYNTNGNPVVISLGDLELNGSATIQMVVAPQVDGFLTNTVEATSDYSDPIPGNNRFESVVTVLPLPKLSISRLPGGQQVRVSWPPALTNWRLLALTNPPDADFSGAWGDVPDSLHTNQLTLPIEMSKTNVFYKLFNPEGY